MWALVILRVFTHERSRFNRLWTSSLLAKLGLISYGLYMYHQSINGLMHGLVFNQEPTVSNLPHLLAALAVDAIAIGVAALSYVYLETPIRQFGHRLSNSLGQSKPAVVAEPAAQSPPG
jgi:peptidoglycan/LPS O-acetylase OafA/YrhL